MRVAPRALAAAGLIVAAGTECWLLWSPPGANDIVGGDEGYDGTIARNIAADPRLLWSTPLSPLEPPGDKPPLYPALLARSARALGPTAAGALSP
jgi:4-amino-4-deoxy-L-arabinose transferase-like glycosyltransferase